MKQKRIRRKLANKKLTKYLGKIFEKKLVKMIIKVK